MNLTKQEIKLLLAIGLQTYYESDMTPETRPVWRDLLKKKLIVELDGRYGLVEKGVAVKKFIKEHGPDKVEKQDLAFFTRVEFY